MKRKKKDETYNTLKQAKAEHENANLAVISVAGEYAGREAGIAIDNNMNVMIFSDNVDIVTERNLKERAHEKGLLVMGPDCGTVIIDGKGICFANKVRKGNIGIAGASGTGIQEAAVLVHKFGGGISHAIGVGGRDVTEEIGAIMLKDALLLLEEDENTEVIMIVSKYPAQSVWEDLEDMLAGRITKPVVINFTTDKEIHVEEKRITVADSLKSAAKFAVSLSKHQEICAGNGDDDKIADIPEFNFAGEQKYMRGLFCGGTLCQEALYYLKKNGLAVYSNVAKTKEQLLEDVFESKADTLLDLGEDEFTNGRPHPMIDATIRNERIVIEAADPEVRVILLDFEIGYGSNKDPAGACAEAIKQGIALAKKDGRELAVVCYVCGTDEDVQNLTRQEQILKEAGAICAKSNIDAVKIALHIRRGAFV